MRACFVMMVFVHILSLRTTNFRFGHLILFLFGGAMILENYEDIPVFLHYLIVLSDFKYTCLNYFLTMTVYKVIHQVFAVKVWERLCRNSNLWKLATLTTLSNISSRLGLDRDYNYTFKILMRWKTFPGLLYVNMPDDTRLIGRISASFDKAWVN